MQSGAEAWDRPQPTRHRRRDLLFAAKMPQVWRPIIQVTNGDRKPSRRDLLERTPSIIIKLIVRFALERSKRRPNVNARGNFASLSDFVHGKERGHDEFQIQSLACKIVVNGQHAVGPVDRHVPQRNAAGHPAQEAETGWENSPSPSHLQLPPNPTQIN